MPPNFTRNDKNITCVSGDKVIGQVKPKRTEITTESSVNVEKDDGDWQVVNRRKKNISRKAAQRPQPIQGTSDDLELIRPAERVSWLFVSGLAVETIPTDIISFLKSKNLDKGVTTRLL